MENKIFNSNETVGFKEFQLATGYISSTVIYYECEKIYVQINAEGYVEFSDDDDELLASVYLPEQSGGKGTYNEVFCGKEDQSLILKFPIVEWIDNYPHCDGEHDRWDTYTIGYQVLNFEILSQNISVREDKI